MTKNTKLSSPNTAELEDLKILFNKENYDLLEIKTKSLLQKYPNIAILYNILGVALEKQGNLNQAISNFDQAISINPKFFLAYNNLGNVMKNLGKFEQSLYHF